MEKLFAQEEVNDLICRERLKWRRQAVAAMKGLAVIVTEEVDKSSLDARLKDAFLDAITRRFNDL